MKLDWLNPDYLQKLNPLLFRFLVAYAIKKKIKPNPNQDYLIYQLLKLNVTMLNNHFELD